MRRLAALVLLASCTLEPRYERPALPVANAFPTGGGGGLAAVDQGWRTVFGDPRLQALIALALANNRDLRIAALNIELTRAQYRIERAALFPEVSATGVASFQRRGSQSGAFQAGAVGTPSGTSQPGAPQSGARPGTPQAGAPQSGAQPGTPQAGAPQSGAQPGATSSGTSLAFYRVGLSASYELDLFGRVRSLQHAALHEYLASVASHRAAHLSLVGEIATQYLRERAYDEQRVLAEQTLASTSQLQSLTQRMFEAGTRSELDVRTAQAQVAGARAEVARLARLRAQAENALVVLVGQPLPANLPAPQPLASQRVVADLSAGVPSDVLLRRPDVIAAEERLRAANADIGAARAAFFPSISLTGFAGFASSALASLFTAGAATWSFVPALSVPLFRGGANVASLDVARVRRRIEVASYEQAIQNAFREVADALVAREYFETQLAAQAERVTAEQSRLTLSQQRYEEGIESYLAVIEAQQDLYQAQNQLIEVRLARLQNLADVYRTLGGGWRER